MANQYFKADGGKRNPLLLMQDLAKPLMVVNRVLDYGAEKYARADWMNVEADRYEAALLRHHSDIMAGEFADAESGLSHRAHLATNALFLLHFEIRANPQVDFLTFKAPPRAHRETTEK